MAKKDKGLEDELDERPRRKTPPEHRLHPDTKKSIWGIACIALAIIFVLAGLAKAGPVGE